MGISIPSKTERGLFKPEAVSLHLHEWQRKAIAVNQEGFIVTYGDEEEEEEWAEAVGIGMFWATW